LNPRLIALAVGVAVVILDQLTKWWALEALEDGPIVIIEDVLQLRITFNSGAAFSLFSGGGPWLGLLAIGIVVLIFAVVRDASHRLDAVALGLVLGGAVGNLLDRIFRAEGLLDGEVIDFVDPSFFATFNVADSAITVGVILLLAGALLRRS